MKIDLTEALSTAQSEREETCALELDAVSIAAGKFPVTEKTPVRVRLFHPEGEKLRVELETSLCVEIPCGRCLEPVQTPFAVSAERVFDLAEETPSYVTDGCELDVDTLVFQELLLHWPARVLCKDDCKGICPVCGANRNVRECGCDRQVLDPRMAAIQDIFDQFQS